MASHRMYPRHLCLVADSSDKPIPTRWETNWPCGLGYPTYPTVSDGRFEASCVDSNAP